MEVEYKQIVINKDWIDKNLIGIDWQRDLYKARVNNFINHLKNGTFREHSLVSLWRENPKDNFMVLDGQHKLEAIKICEINMLVDLRIISNCNKFEAIKEYKSWSDVKHHRTIDIIKLEIFGKKNKYLSEMLDEKEMPLNVTFNGGVNSIRIDNLLMTLFAGRTKSFGNSKIGRNKLEIEIEKITQQEFSLFKQFLYLYKETFGDPFKDNWLYKKIIMTTLYKVWLANKDFFKKEEFIKGFVNLESSGKIRQNTMVSATVGIGAMELTKEIYKVINYKRQNNRFVIFWEEYFELRE